MDPSTFTEALSKAISRAHSLAIDHDQQQLTALHLGTYAVTRHMCHVRVAEVV